MHPHARIRGILLPLALLAGCVASRGIPTGPTSSPTALPSASFPASPSHSAALPNGRIAFVRANGDRRDIFTIHADGSGLEQLTDDGKPKGWLIWLLDGSRLLYTWWTFVDPYHEHLVSMRPDGSEPRELGIVQTYDDPVWSPDGTKVAFGGDGEGDGQTGVFIVDLLDGTLRQLTADGAGYARWSPDGTRIAAILPSRRLELIDPGSGARTIIVEDESIQAPMGWTSDRAIAYSGCSEQMSKEECAAAPLVEVQADGSNPRPYAGDVPFRIEDVRSPDGRWIAVARDDGLYVRAAPAGSSETRLAAGSRPSWSPDALWLVFAQFSEAPTASAVAGAFRLVIMPRSGGTPMTLTDGFDDSGPAWQPARA